MSEIVVLEITRGLYTTLDKEDFDREDIKGYKWNANKKSDGVFYVSRSKRIGKRSENKQMQIYLHRLIMYAKEGEYVDHIDGNPLNNTKNNLRICTNRQNSFNHKGQPKQRKHTKYKGVKKIQKSKKYSARIVVSGKELHLGCFLTESEAAEAYNRAAKEYFGDFAYLNEVRYE